MQVEKRRQELDIELPATAPPVANYVNAVRAGNLLFLAGKGPAKADGTDHATGCSGQMYKFGAITG